MTNLNVTTDPAAVARAKAAAETKQRAEEWLDTLLAQDRTRRIQMATVAVRRSDDLERGQQCWIGDHDGRLAYAQKLTVAIGEALADLRENGIPEMSEAGQAAANAVAARLAKAAGLFYE